MKKKRLLLIPVSLLCMSLLFSCRGNGISGSSNSDVSESSSSTHSHTYDAAWSYDETNHWHNGTCGDIARVDEGTHEFGEWEVVVEPTEESKGSAKRACVVCGYEETKEINESEHVHEIKYVKKVKATCTTDGVKAHYECTTCGKLFKDEDGEVETTQKSLRIKATGHSLVHHAATEAVYGKDGNIEYWSCSNCDKYFSDENGNEEITDKDSVNVQYVNCLRFQYKADSDSYYVTGYFENIGSKLVIPSTYEGKPVTTINNNAFAGLTKLESVVIPDSVSKIGYGAFDGCSNLTSVVIPTSVTYMDNYAFNACSSSLSFYYEGTATDWDKIIKYTGGFDPNSAPRYYYSENTPTIGGNYWRYNSNNEIETYHVHDYTYVAKVDATCEDGYEAHYKCTICGSYFTAEGKNETTLEALTIQATGHSLKKHEAAAATDEKIGTSEYWSCETCGKFFSDSNGNTEITDKTSVLISSANINISYNNYNQTYYVGMCDSSNAKIALIPATYEGSKVSNIDSHAFKNFTKLESIVIPVTITSLYSQVFEETALSKVYYIGSKDDFAKITKGNYNTKFDNATKYYYSETKPTDTENKYWHIVDGVITVWEN